MRGCPMKALRKRGGFKWIRRLGITIRAGCIPSCLRPDRDEVLPKPQHPLLQRKWFEVESLNYTEVLFEILLDCLV